MQTLITPTAARMHDHAAADAESAMQPAEAGTSGHSAHQEPLSTTAEAEGTSGGRSMQEDTAGIADTKQELEGVSEGQGVSAQGQAAADPILAWDNPESQGSQLRGSEMQQLAGKGAQSDLSDPFAELWGARKDRGQPDEL